MPAETQARTGYLCATGVLKLGTGQQVGENPFYSYPHFPLNEKRL